MKYKEIIKLIENARNKQIEANNIENQIFSIFNEKEIDLTLYSGGCNSDNLADMISCYILYGEDDISIIEEKIKNILK